MGKLLFGFTIFWGYIAFGQYLLVYYANIPEETIFYNDHNRGLWIYLTYFLAAGKFVFPTAYLLSQDNKKSLRALTFIAAGSSSCTRASSTGSSRRTRMRAFCQAGRTSLRFSPSGPF